MSRWRRTKSWQRAIGARLVTSNEALGTFSSSIKGGAFSCQVSRCRSLAHLPVHRIVRLVIGRDESRVESQVARTVSHGALFVLAGATKVQLSGFHIITPMWIHICIKHIVDRVRRCGTCVGKRASDSLKGPQSDAPNSVEVLAVDVTSNE